MEKTLSSRTKMDKVIKMEAVPIKMGQLPFLFMSVFVKFVVKIQRPILT
jgi:hypothetical protein